MKNLDNYQENIFELISGGFINCRCICINKAGKTDSYFKSTAYNKEDCENSCYTFCKKENPDSTTAIKITTLKKNTIIYQSKSYRSDLELFPKHYHLLSEKV